MNPKFNAAALKLLEAAKLIQSVKKPDFTERHDDILRGLWNFSAMLLEEKTKAPNKDK